MKFPHRSITLAFCATAFSTSLQLYAGTVTNTNDSGAGSLREAIAAATNGETIDFAPALNGATITLTSGQLSISGLQVTIDASALPAGIKISGNNSSRIFSITDNSNVTLNSLELFNGRVTGSGGGILASQSQLNFSNITIRNCVSSGDGGGFWANPISGTIDRCSFLGNDSGAFGGGVFVGGTTSATIQNSVVSGNRSNGGGGGIAHLGSSASLSIINCTIQGNSGSGIYLSNSAPLLRNTIVWGNRTGSGTVASQQIQIGPFPANPNVDYCLVEGTAATLNNLNGTLPANNPNFVSPATPVNSTSPPNATADLRVFTNSPVLNVGNNGSNSSLLDRAGKTRVQATTIDLGAYEGGYVTFSLLHPLLNPNEDSNGNGISNFAEYASATDPSGPDNSATRPMISRSGEFNFLTASRRSNALDVVFSWETSTSMEAESWQPMVWGINYTVEATSSPSPEREETIFKLLDTDPRRFYRQSFLSN